MSTKKVFKNSIIYTVVTLLQRSMGLLLLPLYTYFISPAEYGTLSVITSITNFIAIFFLMGIPSANTRFHYLFSNNKEQQKIVWGNNLTLVLINTVFISLVIILFNKYLLTPFANGIEFYPLLFIGMAASMLNSPYLFYQSFLQTTQNGKKYGINLTFNFIINTSLIILFITYFDLGILGVLLANLITALLFSFHVVFSFIPKITLGINKRQALSSIKYSLPLLPHSVSFWVVNMVDRILINKLDSATATGIYNVGNQIGGTINTITSSVNQAYCPWFYDIINDPSSKNLRAISETVKIISMLYCFAALSLSLFAKEIIQLLASPAYMDAWPIVSIIAFSCVFLGYYHFFFNIILLEKKTKHVPIITLFAATASVILNLIFIPQLGGLGAAISNFIANFSTSLLTLFLSRKLRKDIKFDYIRMYLFLFGMFLISSISYIDISLSIFYFMFFKAVILIGLIVGWYIVYNRPVKQLISNFSS